MSRFSWLITVWADWLASGICFSCKQCRVIQDVRKESYWIAALDTSVLHHWRPDLNCTQLDPAQEEQGIVSNSWGRWKPPHVPWWPPTAVPWNTSRPRSSPPRMARAQDMRFQSGQGCRALQRTGPAIFDRHPYREEQDIWSAKWFRNRNGETGHETSDVCLGFLARSVQPGDISLHMTVHVSRAKHLFQPSNMGQGIESQIWVWLNMRTHCLTATSPINSDISPTSPVAAAANKQVPLLSRHRRVLGFFVIPQFLQQHISWTGDAKLPLSVHVCILYRLVACSVLVSASCTVTTGIRTWFQTCLYCHG